MSSATRSESHAPVAETEAILSWRLWVLARAGYGAEHAMLLAGSRDVDLHAAVGLLERGCPPDTALRILV